MRQLIDAPDVRSRKEDAAILRRAKKKAPATKKSGGGLSSIISTIVANVNRYLGKYIDEYRTVSTEEELSFYIDGAIEYGYIAIDTETTGLDPMVDTMVGMSLYFPGEKPIYVPIGHVSYVTGSKLKNQIDIEAVKRQIKCLGASGCKIIMCNAVFDIRIIYHATGILLECWWETYLAAMLLNENEEHALKKLHAKYVLKGKEDEFKFDELFKGVKFLF